jgi:hypothetical protein
MARPSVTEGAGVEALADALSGRCSVDAPSARTQAAHSSPVGNDAPGLSVTNRPGDAEATAVPAVVVVELSSPSSFESPVAGAVAEVDVEKSESDWVDDATVESESGSTVCDVVESTTTVSAVWSVPTVDSVGPALSALSAPDAEVEVPASNIDGGVAESSPERQPAQAKARTTNTPRSRNNRLRAERLTPTSLAAVFENHIVRPVCSDWVIVVWLGPKPPSLGPI